VKKIKHAGWGMFEGQTICGAIRAWRTHEGIASTERYVTCKKCQKIILKYASREAGKLARKAKQADANFWKLAALYGDGK
jgi:hypothetical protein